MMQLAGEIGDGVLFSNVSSCEYVKRSIEQIRIGAEKSGRKLADLDVACLISTTVSADPKKAGRIAKETVLRYVSRPERGEMILGPNYSEELRTIRETMQKGDWRTALRYVSDEMVDLATASGTPRECREKIEEFASAGINLPIIIATPTSDFEAAIRTFKRK